MTYITPHRIRALRERVARLRTLRNEQAFWDSAQESAERVAKWPEWKRQACRAMMPSTRDTSHGEPTSDLSATLSMGRESMPAVSPTEAHEQIRRSLSGHTVEPKVGNFGPWREVAHMKRRIAAWKQRHGAYRQWRIDREAGIETRFSLSLHSARASRRALRP